MLKISLYPSTVTPITIEKVISLYARGMSTRDIHDQLSDLYGVEMSAEMVSKITDKILPQVKEWQSRPLNPVYPFVFMDCIHYKVREDGRILSRAAYIVMGVTARDIPLVFGDQLWLELPIAVPGQINLEFPILALEVFGGISM